MVVWCCCGRSCDGLEELLRWIRGVVGLLVAGRFEVVGVVQSCFERRREGSDPIALCCRRGRSTG